MHPCSFSQPQKRKGVIIDVDRRSLSADRAPFSLSSPALTRPHHPFPAFPTFLPSTIHCNLLLSLPVNLSPSLSPHPFSCRCLTSHLFLGVSFSSHPFFRSASSLPSFSFPSFPPFLAAAVSHSDLHIFSSN